jgi:hypothetical protein
MQSKFPDADLEATAAQRQIALERDGGDAGEWCELGECYNTLASDSPDEETAMAWREKAAIALTRAIALRPGLGKAHYALANVYRAQDMRLALLELEAAAKCDPAYAGALADAREHVRNCTYTLQNLPCTVLESAQETPRPEILASEFYFEDGPIRSAAVHTCLSKGVGQFAKVWLFDSPEEMRDTAQPVAEVAISSSGSVSVSRLRPNDDQTAAAGEVAPSAAAAGVRGKPVVSAPLTMLFIALAGTLFAYRILVAPPPPRGDERAAREVTSEAASRSAASDAASIVNAASPKVLPSTPSDVPPPSAAQVQRGTASHASKASSVQHRPQEHNTPPMAISPGTSAPPAVATIATGSTHTPAMEGSLPVPSVEPASAQPTADAAPQAPALAEPSIQPASAPAPLPEKRASAVAPVSPSGARKQQRPPTRAVATRSAPPAPRAMTWLTGLRSALAACGRSGVLLNDVCREAARWKHCHPDHWDTVQECAVQRFASSGASN